MHLLVGFYQDAASSRTEEFVECVHRNANTPYVDSVTVFLEDRVSPSDLCVRYPAFTHAKVRLVEHGRRLTYEHLFEYANRHHAGAIVAIANADIFFDETVARAADWDLDDTLLCLSRWDERPDEPPVHFAQGNSQDAWIFRAPLKPFRCDWHMGVLGCDNRLAFEAARVGLRLLNPSRSIRARHLHRSGVRNYTHRNRLKGGYRDVPVLDEPATVLGSDQATTMRALTSLSPSPSSEGRQKECIRSWRAAGLRPVSFNHPSEIAALRDRYDIDFVAVENTTEAVFGRPLVPVSALLRHASRLAAPVLLINSDIELTLAPWELRRIRWLSRDGLCYFVRFNHERDTARAQIEPHGIDAFLLHGRDASLFPDSVLSVGQPFWDYWLPHVFLRAGRPVYAVEFPAALHRNHPRRWSPSGWNRAAVEFQRVTSALGDHPPSFGWKSTEVRQSISHARRALPPRPEPIQTWVTRRFSRSVPKTFLELGSHRGTDTAWLAALPRVTVHAFEPDPRNQQPKRANVIQNRAAIAAHDGHAEFILSERGWDQEWTHSSSLRRPKHHLTRYPVTFGRTVEVETVSLDSYARSAALDVVDFIWADVQGAEGDMVKGGRELLDRTRFLFTSYSDEEMYEGQLSLAELLALLPGFRVVELWEQDVLLENNRFAACDSSKAVP